VLSRGPLARDALRYFSALFRGSLGTFLRQATGDVTLADLAERWARKRPAALALEVAGARLSYAELSQAGLGAAQSLQALGARSGDVVALVGRNSVAYVAALLGGARSGITLALVHPELGGEPLRQALTAAGAGYVLCEQPLEAAVREASALPRASFDPESRTPFPALSSGGEFAPERRLRDFALVYTSGTTGLPKACRLPHSRVLTAACLFGAPLFDFRKGDKLLCALPLHHGSPLMLGLGACLVSGTPLVLERGFSARDFMSVAAQSRATAMLYVGDLGRMLLATPESTRDREHALRVAVGNGMAADVWPKFQARFGIPSVREFYAATESPVGIFNLSGRIGSVGNLPYAWMFGLKLGRLDQDGELARDQHGRLIECELDEPGELLVRARRSGLGVYHGYVDQSATEARLVHNAFSERDMLFRTFDVLRRDADGFYYFVERGGDSYRFRGENVAVALVERELSAITGVLEAIVTGVEVSGYDGRVGLAVVVRAPSFDVARLEALSERLPKSALPRFVRFEPELSRTSSLKLKRRAWASAGVDPERVSSELWVLVDGKYKRLDVGTYRDIVSGKVRL
jgi:fatty-acyl-CoA synthase